MGKGGKGGKGGKQVAQRAATVQFEKIPGTKIKMLNGVPVRVVHQTGQEFHPNNVQGAWGHVEKMGRSGGQQGGQQGWQQKGSGKGKGQKKGQQTGQVKLQVQPKAKSKGSAKGQMQFKVPPTIKNSTKGTKGAGKGAKGSKSQVKFRVATIAVKKHVLKNGQARGKGGKRAKTEKKELSPEEEEARREKQADRHAAKCEKEMRMVVSDTYFTGEVVARGKFFAWVKPQSPPIPASVLPELKKMNDEFRAKSAEDSDGKQRIFCNGIKENVVYVSSGDIQEADLNLTEGLAVQFKLYTDSKGVGGCEVISA